MKNSITTKKNILIVSSIVVVILLTIIYFSFKDGIDKRVVINNSNEKQINADNNSTTTNNDVVSSTTEVVIDKEESNLLQEEPILLDKPEVIPNPNWWEYPPSITDISTDPNSLTVIVNKGNKLPSWYEPSDLIDLSSQDLGGIRSYAGLSARNIIVEDLRSLGYSATQSGIDLGIVSAYRSYSTQESTYNYWVSIDGQTEADKYSARAGHSQHQLGTAIDFTTNEGYGDLLWDQFNNTNAANWLSNNAWQYGFYQSYPSGYEVFTGYKAESWHYRYIGKENSSFCHNNGLILEDCLKQL